MDYSTDPHLLLILSTSCDKEVMTDDAEITSLSEKKMAI